MPSPSIIDAGTTDSNLIPNPDHINQNNSVDIRANTTMVGSTVIDLTGSDNNDSSVHQQSPQPMGLNPSSDVQPEEDTILVGLDDSIQSISMNKVSVPNAAPPVAESSDTENNDGFKLPYYEDLENLGDKEEGCLFRVQEKTFCDDKTSFNEYEFVPLLKDRITYQCFKKVVVNVRNSGDAYARRIYLDHREVKAWYFLKWEDSWGRLESQVRAQCFECALSSRYARIALEKFKDVLFNKRMSKLGRINPAHLQWSGLAEALKIQPCHVVQ